MKIAVVFISILALAYTVRVDYDSLFRIILNHFETKNVTSTDDVSEAFVSFMKEISGELELKLCKKRDTKVYEAAEKSVECAKKLKTNGLMCDTLIALDECILPIQVEIENCLEEKYQDLPTLLVRILSATVNFICDRTVKDIIEIFNPCVYNLGDQCMKEFDQSLKLIESSKFVKDDFCQILGQTSQCFLNEIKKGCKNGLTSKIYSELYDAVIQKQCENSESD